MSQESTPGTYSSPNPDETHHPSWSLPRTPRWGITTAQRPSYRTAGQPRAPTTVTEYEGYAV